MGDDYFESQKANGFLQEKERKWAPKEPLFPTFDPFWYKEEELSGCFSPCSIVNGNEVRFLANHFVDERGKISLDRLKETIFLLKKKQIRVY